MFPMHGKSIDHKSCNYKYLDRNLGNDCSSKACITDRNVQADILLMLNMIKMTNPNQNIRLSTRFQNMGIKAKNINLSNPIPRMIT